MSIRDASFGPRAKWLVPGCILESVRGRTCSVRRDVVRLSIRLTVTLLATVLAGCQATFDGSPSAATSTGASESTPSEPAPSASASAGVAASEAASPSAAAPSDPATGLEDWTGGQLFLLSGVARATRPTCGPAPELPPEATAGIQCRLPGITAIGFYLYEDADTMREAYFARLAEFGVEPDSGQVCRDGSPGEGADTPGLEGFEHRIGCYVDADGIAQVRAAMPAVAASRSVYIGVAGTDGSIADLLVELFGSREGIIGCNFCVSSLWFAAQAD
jgi:hypothetical protein